MTDPSNSSVATDTKRLNTPVMLLLALLLGLWTEYLFFLQPLGVNILMLSLTGVSALVFLAWKNQIQPVWRNIWLAAAVLLFAGLTALRAAQFTAWLNLLAALGLSGYWAHLFTSGDMRRFKFSDYFISAAVAGIEISLFGSPISLTDAFHRSGEQQGARQIGSVLRGLLLAAPLVILLTILLASADIAFNQAVLDAFRMLKPDNIPELVGRLIFWFCAAWLILGGFTYALRSSQIQAALPARANLSKLPMGLTESAIVIGSVDLLFAAFVAIQFRYFFGGQGNIHVAGFTYAEYARRGFAELVMVAVFSLGLALILHGLTKRSSRAQGLTFEVLADILIILTGIILVSAFRRLTLYEEAYGFTQLRTYTHIFILLLGVLLIGFMLCLRFNRSDLFTFGVFIACLGFVITLNILDTDAFIARQNINRYKNTAVLDVAYLATLSDDAIPDLVRLLDNPDPETRAAIGSVLHNRLDILEAKKAKISWPGWNWASFRAYNLLQEIRPKLNQYSIQTR